MPRASKQLVCLSVGHRRHRDPSFCAGSFVTAYERVAIFPKILQFRGRPYSPRHNEGLPKCRGRREGQDNAVRILDPLPAGHRFDRPGLGRPSGSLLEAQSAIHVFHELAKILVSGRALRADLRNVLVKLLAYSSFDRRRFWAPQLSKKSPVNGEVCWIAYNPHCLRHRRRRNFATLLLRTLGL